jgi:nitroreductase
MHKQATPDHPIHELVANRWSPYAFADHKVADADLRSLFEAARWAASSYNEQPWSYIVATRDDAAEFACLLACLVEGNQAWAKAVPVLAIGYLGDINALAEPYLQRDRAPRQRKPLAEFVFGSRWGSAHARMAS